MLFHTMLKQYDKDNVKSIPKGYFISKNMRPLKFKIFAREGHDWFLEQKYNLLWVLRVVFLAA